MTEPDPPRRRTLLTFYARNRQTLLLSISAAAEELGIDRTRLGKAVREGRVTAVQVGKRLKIARAELERITRDGLPDPRAFGAVQGYDGERRHQQEASVRAMRSEPW